MRALMFGVCVGTFCIASAGVAQLPVEEQLAQIDRTFVCPESLPNDAAREAATRLFIEQVRAAQPVLTVAQLVSYRMTLLRRHACSQTLAIIAAQSQAGTPPVRRQHRPD